MDTAPAPVSLTPAQQQELQAQVDAYLKQSPGGKQVSVNELDYGTLQVIFVLPGEKYARSLNEQPSALPSCQSAFVCLWSSTHFSGTMARDSSCHGAAHIGLPFKPGSIINNQIGNEPTTFYNSGGGILEENQAFSAVDDFGVDNRRDVASWRVCVH